jgi:hypothetical protein
MGSLGAPGGGGGAGRGQPHRGFGDEQQRTTRKWRRKPLESLEMDSATAIGRSPSLRRKIDQAHSVSHGQFDDAAQKLAGISALADMDLEPPRLQDAFEALANE